MHPDNFPRRNPGLYPTKELNDKADNLPSNTFLIFSRRRMSLGVFCYRTFVVDPKPEETMITAFYRLYGHEFELGYRYEWNHRIRQRESLCWRFFKGTL